MAQLRQRREIGFAKRFAHFCRAALPLTQLIRVFSFSAVQAATLRPSLTSLASAHHRRHADGATPKTAR
jgi:hypothetical protein